MKKYKVAGLLLRLEFEETVQHRRVRRYRGRPARVMEEREWRVSVTVDEEAAEKVIWRKGWGAMLSTLRRTGCPWARPSRPIGKCIIERGDGRLKGRPLSLTCVWGAGRSNDRLDSAAAVHWLRGLTLLEFVVCRCLAQEDAELTGLCVGNPRRTTARPTAERLLEAFKGLTLTLIREPHRRVYHLPPLSDLQRRILDLLDFTPDVYTRL